MMTSPHDPIHPQHPHHLECPRCGRRAVVVRGESRFICLSCGWQRNVDDPWGCSPLFLMIMMAVTVLLIVLLTQG